MIGALPRRPLEATGRSFGQRAAGGQGVLDGLKRGAHIVAEPLEPGAGLLLAGVKLGQDGYAHAHHSVFNFSSSQYLISD
jgi:hypothetical protein